MEYIKSIMKKSEFENYLGDFFTILEKSNFKKKDFLFNSKPYIDGFYFILNKIKSLYEDVDIPNKKVFDLGCGTGMTSYLLARLGFIVDAVDIYDKNQDIINAFKKKGKMSQEKIWRNLCDALLNFTINYYDGEHIPYKNDSFDLVFAHAVLEHIPSSILPHLVEEIMRILKKDGYLIIARTPNKYALTEFLAKSHDIKFSKKEILKLFYDFNYEKIYYTKTDFFPEVGPSKSCQDILNFFSPFTHLVDIIISKTPLEIFSHHHFLILKKV